MTTPEQIYAAYPRKVGRKAALVAINKALHEIEPRIDRCTPEWLLERVQIYAASHAGNRGKFTPIPTTWFNQGRYDDDPEEWQAKGDGDGDTLAAKERRELKESDRMDANRKHDALITAERVRIDALSDEEFNRLAEIGRRDEPEWMTRLIAKSRVLARKNRLVRAAVGKALDTEGESDGR